MIFKPLGLILLGGDDLGLSQELVAEEVLSSCFDQGYKEADGVLAATDKLVSPIIRRQEAQQKMAQQGKRGEQANHVKERVEQKVRKLKIELAEQKVNRPEQGRKETQFTGAIQE